MAKADAWGAPGRTAFERRRDMPHRSGLAGNMRLIAEPAYGRLLATGTVEEVVKNAGLTTFVVQGPNLDAVARELESRPGLEQVAPFGATLHVVGSNAGALQAALADIGQRHPGVTASPGETSLEDVFIQFMAGSKDNMG